MQFVRHNSATDFYDACIYFLDKHPIVNNVIIGLVYRMFHNNESFGETYFVHIENDKAEIVATAIRAGRGALISTVEDESALPVLIDAFAETYDTLPDVVGMQDDCLRFAEIWQEKSGQSFSILMEMGLYRLDKVVPPENVSGYARVATEEDYELLVDWVFKFSSDTGVDPGFTRDHAEKHVRTKLNKPLLGGIRLWIDDGQPVSMAAVTRELKDGGNVSMVYTPPQFRGHGYASAVTASASQAILDYGKSFACLTTDMANPTSNKIYQAIGYQFVGNHRKIVFEDRK